jgi:uncharacterized DUF497 family protein
MSAFFLVDDGRYALADIPVITYQRIEMSLAWYLETISSSLGGLAYKNHICYIYFMSSARINKSALKHGISEADIRMAIVNFIYEAPISGEENKFIAIGFDGSGNLVEVVYEYIENETIHVFHAMKCRKAVLELFEK